MSRTTDQIVAEAQTAIDIHDGVMRMKAELADARARLALFDQMREALKEAQIFLNVGASFAPNVEADVAFNLTKERFRSRGLADVMRAVAEEAGVVLARIEAMEKGETDGHSSE